MLRGNPYPIGTPAPSAATVPVGLMLRGCAFSSVSPLFFSEPRRAVPQVPWASCVPDASCRAWCRVWCRAWCRPGRCSVDPVLTGAMLHRPGPAPALPPVLGDGSGGRDGCGPRDPREPGAGTAIRPAPGCRGGAGQGDGGAVPWVVPAPDLGTLNAWPVPAGPKTLRSLRGRFREDGPGAGAARVRGLDPGRVVPGDHPDGPALLHQAPPRGRARPEARTRTARRPRTTTRRGRARACARRGCTATGRGRAIARRGCTATGRGRAIARRACTATGRGRAVG